MALELALAGHARSVTAIAPAGLWAQPLMPKRSPRARARPRAAARSLPALLRSERGRRAALGGTIAHPERVPYAAALQLVRAYADAPGFEAANAGDARGALHRAGPISTSRSRSPGPSTTGSSPARAAFPRPRANIVLRGCGHMPTWDDPEQVAAVLLAAAPRRRRRSRHATLNSPPSRIAMLAR